MTPRLLANVTVVAVEGRGLLIEGPPGSGKSSLALALIDRGAVLVGDDGVELEDRAGRLWALPPPNIAGMLEVRGVGIVTVQSAPAPIALVLSLGDAADRLPEPEIRDFEGIAVPCLPFALDGSLSAVRAEWALKLHGLPSLPDDQ